MHINTPVHVFQLCAMAHAPHVSVCVHKCYVHTRTYVHVVCVDVCTHTHVFVCMCQSVSVLVCAVWCTVGVGCYCVGDFELCPSLSLAGLLTHTIHKTCIYTHTEHTHFNELVRIRLQY